MASTPTQVGQKFPSTIASLVKYFIGLDLTVELKNGRTFRGLLHFSDDFMNLTLSQAGQSNALVAKSSSLNDCNFGMDLTLDPLDYSILHIRGSSIRYIHFPTTADLPILIKLGMERERAARDKYARGKRSRS